MSISASQRQFVIRRAAGCCEYCRLAQISTLVSFHVDHVIPTKHDGSDDSSNLSFACFKCNGYKSHDLTGFDPLTGNITPLFHPRNQIWNEHFELQPDMKIIGLTPEGRTTVRVLNMNDEKRVENRQALADIGEYPC